MKTMTLSNRITLWLILGLSLAYFLIFSIPNSRGADTEQMLQSTSLDEPVNYPYVVRMLMPAQDLKDLFSRWILYADYHYGYPFYFLSSAVLLPVRWAFGAHFTDHTGLNLLLLRQLISVLPMLLAVVLLVYMQTRFRSAARAVGLLVILLTVRGIVRNNLQWWHPDALSVLAVILTLFFLQRDRLRFQRDFWLAAVTCGVAMGIKLAGFFFFLTIPAYLLSGLYLHHISFKKVTLLAMAFVIVAGATLVVSNPFLYSQGGRNDLVKIQKVKQVELSQGYTHDDPKYYAKGPAWWDYTLRLWYGNAFFLGFALLSLLVGCLWGDQTLLNRLILSWIVPFSIYLLYFVAPKPDHYWLPVMLPLLSTLLNIPIALHHNLIPWLQPRPGIRRALLVLTILILGSYLLANFLRPGTGILTLFKNALAIEGLT